MMKGIGGKGVLALSLVLGVATSYMVYQYVDQAGRAAKPVQTVQVITAATNIAPRTTITGEMLRIVRIPADLKLPQAVATVDQVTGKVSKLPITKGEQVLTNKVFGDREESGLAFVIPPGKRAVAVGVNEVVGSGGLILPGDAVDVVAVVDTQAANVDAPLRFGAPPLAKQEITAISQYVLQNVEVLAVAQEIQGSNPDQSLASKAVDTVAPNHGSQPPKQRPSMQPGARTVTLAVNPEDAEKLVLAEDKARIRLVLRAHGDDGTIKLDDSLFGSLGGAATLQRQP